MLGEAVYVMGNNTRNSGLVSVLVWFTICSSTNTAQYEICYIIRYDIWCGFDAVIPSAVQLSMVVQYVVVTLPLLRRAFSYLQSNRTCPICRSEVNVTPR